MTENGDATNVLAELETAAQILLAPPNLVTGEQRCAADAIFVNFRKHKTPFQLCKHILETSKVDFVLFESAELMKDGLIREWKDLQPEDIVALRSYLFDYVLRTESLSSYVREKIIQVVAIIIKRQTADDEGAFLRTVLDPNSSGVQSLITSENVQIQMVGCSLISAIITEFGTTVKSSDVGLSWETHFFLKKQFEETDLKSIFELCSYNLNKLLDTPLSQPISNLLLRLITIAESVLSWRFISINLPKKLVSFFESDHNPSFRPGVKWEDTILDPNIVNLFFTLHLKVRQDSELAHHTLNCLIQLSSLNGTVVAKRNNRVEYLRNYLEQFIMTLNKVGSIRPAESLGFSNIIRQLVLFFPRKFLVFLYRKILDDFSQKITQLTIHAMKASFQKNNLDDDSGIHHEAFEHYLSSWISITNDCPTLPREFVQACSVEIFNSYVQCNLCAPDGIRGSQEDDEEICDNEDDSDRVKYKDILSTIGHLGRCIAEHSIPLLSQILENRLSRLHGQIQRIASQGGRSIDKFLEDLYEDIHWILLILGNVLAFNDPSETVFIPVEIMRYTFGKAKEVNVETSMHVLASPGQPVSDIPGHQSMDPVVRLISGVYKLAEVEKRAVEAGLHSLLSPEVSSSIMWTLQKVASTYLAFQEKCYEEISMSLIAAFGQNTDGLAWTVNFFIEKIISNLTNLSSEPKIVEDTIDFFGFLVDEKEKRSQVIKSPGLISLIELEASSSLHLPQFVKRRLMKSFVLIGSSCKDQSSRNNYWSKVLEPLNNRFTKIISNPDLKKIYNEDKIRISIISIIESFIGVAQGCAPSTAKQLFIFLQPVLRNMVYLLDIYHNYSDIVELILQLYCETARCTLYFLNQEDSKIFYQGSIEILRMYTHHNKGKRCYEKRKEDEQFLDVLLLMKLLTNLLSKDFIIDLYPPDYNDQEEATVTAADACLCGLNIIMPLMSLELLKIPTLCLEYFKTITLICKFHPEKICSLSPQELQNNLIVSLELGMTSVVAVDTVFSLCCEFIHSICLHIIRTRNKEVQIYEALRPFLKIILDMVLSQRVNSDMIPCAGGTLYALACCYPETYNELIQFLIESQKNMDVKQRLSKAFHELMKNQRMDMERENRSLFKENFVKFIVNVRGFLLVK